MKAKIQRIPGIMETLVQQFQEETASFSIRMFALPFDQKHCSEAKSSLMLN